MKVLEHGKNYRQTPPVKVRCECGCLMEVSDHDLEGWSTLFVWCIECREPVYLPEKAVRDITVVHAEV
jgi:hypothetical protein